MWEFFIKNSKFAYLFLIVLLAVGGYSIASIPKESAPEVVIPVGVVNVTLPGANAADIESQITNEIERNLTSLDNVDKITSTSREGVSTVVVEFNASADIDESISDLKDEIDKIKTDLPSDAGDPFVTEVDFQDQPILTVALSADISNFAFTKLGDEIEEEVETVSGVSEVELVGTREREVAVIVNQESLQRFNISLSEVTNAISSANLTFPIGQITNDGVSYNVAFEGDVTDTTQVQNIGVTSRGGQPIYIKDIAVVEDGLSSASTISRLSVDGQPSVSSIAINVYKQSGGDITAITSAVNDRIDELKQPNQLLEGITTAIVLDSGKDISDDLIQLSTSGLETVLLVVVLLMFAIGWREGLLAGAAIPLSFLFGFIGLYFSGNTINFLSLFSLILGIGILVDSAIVMIEGINRKMKENKEMDKKEAAISAIHEFKTPLISGTLTTVSMFVGLFIVTGIVGEFISSIPFTLIFLLFSSLFVALSILPLIASTFLKSKDSSDFEAKQTAFAQKFSAAYRKKMAKIIGHVDVENKFKATLFALLVFSVSLVFSVFVGLLAAPMIYFVTLKSHDFKRKYYWSEFKRKLALYSMQIASITIAFVVAGAVFPTINPVKVIFFDETDSDYIIVEIEEPEGTVKEVTDIATRRVEEIFYDEEEILSFSVTVGSGSQWGSGASGEKYSNLLINLKPERERNSLEIIEDWREQIGVLSDINVTISQPGSGPPTGSPVLVKFLGDDMTELSRLTNETAEIFKETEGTVNVETSTNNNSTEFVLELDRDKATALGVTPSAVSQIARTALFGADATALTTLDDDIDVVVKLNIGNEDRPTSEDTKITSINELSGINITTQSGQVPLSNLVEVSLRESNSIIEHEGGERVVTVSSDIAENANAREVQATIIAEINSRLDIPEGIILSTGGGESDDSNQAFGEMFLALVVGVMMMVGILTLQFNSYRHMRYVLSILPYSLIGIFTGLAITGSPLSFPSMMGFIALSGIVVNNSILLIDMMNQSRRKHPEKDVTEIVLDSASSRLRPILLTTITTIIGMVPLTFAGDMWAPLAYAVMFGLLFSVVITLVLIPITYNRNPGDLPN